MAKDRKLRFIVLIPAYEPDETLNALVDEILSLGASNRSFGGILVVDDGSISEESCAVFSRLESRHDVDLVKHPENRGKGGALKTGFREISEKYENVGFVVTADADGQHKPSDIFKLAEHALSTGNPNIGYRTFSGDIPFRSRLGNIITSLLFNLTGRTRVHDTQSGLRTYLVEDLPSLIEIAADRYEYEFHCLFKMARRRDRPLEQIPIETIYEPGNPTSHFNPLVDSVRIYFVFFRYMSVSALSGMLDFLVFAALNMFGVSTLTALIFARICSAPIYFYGMRNIVFKSHGIVWIQALATLLLMAFHVFFLWRFIAWLEGSFGIHSVIAMMAGLITFYVGNFLVQRFIIYPFRQIR